MPNCHPVEERRGERSHPPRKERSRIFMVQDFFLLVAPSLSCLDLGIDSFKWNSAKKAKPAAAAALSATNAEVDFGKRESVFEEYREELTAEFKQVSILHYL